MNELNPRARALIESAVRHEEGPTAAELGRVRRSVLSGLATSGAVAGAATTTLIAKAAAAVGGTAAQITAYAVAGAIAAGGTLAVHERLAGDTSRAATVAAISNGTARRASELGKRAPPPADEPAVPIEDGPGPNVGGPIPPIVAAPSLPAPSLPMPSVASPILTAPSAPSDARPGALSPDTGGARAPGSVLSHENVPAGNDAPAPFSAQVGAPPSDGTVQGRSSSDLAQQLAYLRGMRAELHAGNASRALELSRESEALFSGSALEAEARAARIAALCPLGQFADARGAIERFRQLFPNSALLRNVENACAIDVRKKAGH